MGVDVEEDPHGTWVSLLRLEFHHFNYFFFLAFFLVLTQRSSSSSRPIEALAFFLYSSSLRQIVPLFFVVRSFFRANLTQRSSSSSRPIGTPAFFLCSLSFRQIIPLFFVVRSFLCSSSLDRSSCFRSIILQVPKSSLRDSVLLSRTQVYKTRDLSGIIFSNSPSGKWAFN